MRNIVCCGIKHSIIDPQTYSRMRLFRHKPTKKIINDIKVKEEYTLVLGKCCKCETTVAIIIRKDKWGDRIKGKAPRLTGFTNVSDHLNSLEASNEINIPQPTKNVKQLKKIPTKYFFCYDDTRQQLRAVEDSQIRLEKPFDVPLRVITQETYINEGNKIKLAST